jgi:hypothetical protein
LLGFATVPSFLHESVVALFRNRPRLAAELLSDLGVRVPAHALARLVEPNVAELIPTEYRADAVVLLEQEQPIFAVVVEVQLFVDADKPFVWPLYTAALRARWRVPTCLLVVAPDPRVGAWARTPIATGQPDSSFTPAVIGPEAVPRIADIDSARAAPELAVLSVIAHGEETGAESIALAAIAAAADLDSERGRLYNDVILSALGDAARSALEAVMQNGRYEYQSEFARKYYGQGLAEGEAKGKAEGEAKGKAEGEAKGKAEALIAVLAARGFALSDDLRAKILDCHDPTTLDRWITQAVTAASPGEALR